MTQDEFKDEIRKFLRSPQELDDIMNFLTLGRSYFANTPDGLSFNQAKQSVELALAEEENDLLNMQKELLEESLDGWEEPEDYDQVVNEVCGFVMSWVGKCKEINCKRHNVNCGCGKKATHDCGATIGAMVCGRPLCANCRCSH